MAKFAVVLISAALCFGCDGETKKGTGSGRKIAGEVKNPTTAGKEENPTATEQKKDSPVDSPETPATTSLPVTTDTGAIPTPPFLGYTYDNMKGFWAPKLLQGYDFVLTFFHSTGFTGSNVSQIVSFLRAHDLANGLFPGPSAAPSMYGSISDYQTTWNNVVNSDFFVVPYAGTVEADFPKPSVTYPDIDFSFLSLFQERNKFTGIHLAEWDWYFHHSSMLNSWWSGNCRISGCISVSTPTQGWGGYKENPFSKPRRIWFFDQMKSYFQSRNSQLQNVVINGTGHSTYDHYAAEWGSQALSAEVAEGIANAQMKIAYLRGASRQYNKPMLGHVSAWYSAGSCNEDWNKERIDANGYIFGGVRGGHSWEYLSRTWLYLWFAGVAAIMPEKTDAMFAVPDPASGSYQTTTAHGKDAAEIFKFMKNTDRGLPFTPVAFVLDHYSGYGPLSPLYHETARPAGDLLGNLAERSWGVDGISPSDREALTIFRQVVFPKSNFYEVIFDTAKGWGFVTEQHYMRPTPYGEIFDVLLTNANLDVLKNYRTLILAGSYPIFLDEPYAANVTVDEKERLKIERCQFVNNLKVLLESDLQIMVPESKKDLILNALPECQVPNQELFSKIQIYRNVDDFKTMLGDLAKHVSPVTVTVEKIASTQDQIDPASADGSVVIAKIDEDFQKNIQYQINRTKKGWMIELVNNLGAYKNRFSAPLFMNHAVTVRLSPKIKYLKARKLTVKNGSELLRMSDSPIQTEITLDLMPAETVFLEFIDTADPINTKDCVVMKGTDFSVYFGPKNVSYDTCHSECDARAQLANSRFCKWGDDLFVDGTMPTTFVNQAQVTMNWVSHLTPSNKQNTVDQCNIVTNRGERVFDLGDEKVNFDFCYQLCFAVRWGTTYRYCQWGSQIFMRSSYPR